MKNFIDALIRDDRGATAVEYGLIVSLIAGAIIVTVSTIGASLAATFATISNAL